MCNRYAQYVEVAQLADQFEVAGPLPNARPSWNVAPTAQAPVVRSHPETHARHLDLLQWGLVPRWAQDPKSTRRPTNARAEGIAESRMFRDAFLRRRCLVPADAYYEWKVEGGEKLPHAIARTDGTPMALAGIWEGWKSAEGEILRTYAVITTRPNREMAEIHDRMPVVLEPGAWPAWLGEGGVELRDLLEPAAEGVLHAWRVGRAVGNVRNNGPELLEPAA